ncbi:hypothetical protein [uncultured Oscillibacter sp.]|uniref:hypothetical protein n=1 Tax=uncultured Oscillibacter sp. TaxID=876091 RepID=UPI0025DC691A|nr:hypothetical protein [uncultured Oscillibacter sp.]
MSGTIFREKSLEKISSPEQMNDYIRVSSPSVWMVLAAVIVLLAGVCVWGVFGHLDTAVQTGGVCTNGRLTVFVGEEDHDKIRENAVISVDGVEYAVAESTNAPVRVDDQIDPYIVHLAGFTEGDWVYRLCADAPGLADGVYTASVVTERVRPLDFVLN